jgi:hypothetical protein
MRKGRKGSHKVSGKAEDIAWNTMRRSNFCNALNPRSTEKVNYSGSSVSDVGSFCAHERSSRQRSKCDGFLGSN